MAAAARGRRNAGQGKRCPRVGAVGNADEESAGAKTISAISERPTMFLVKAMACRTVVERCGRGSARVDHEPRSDPTLDRPRTAAKLPPKKVSSPSVEVQFTIYRQGRNRTWAIPVKIATLVLNINTD